MEYVAHRAGNDLDQLRELETRADLIEVDVHLGPRRDGEARHAKSLWGTGRYWERWFLIEPGVQWPTLSDVIGSARPDTALWLDLKGVSPRLADLANDTIGQGRPIVVSTKSWWLLGRIRRIDGVRTFRSAGNRFELALLSWLPTRVRTDGAVVHRRLLSDRVIRRLRRRGALFTWNVHDQATIDRLERLGVDGVILDDAGLLPDR